VVAFVAEWAELRRVLKLTRVLHYSPPCYAERRLTAAATGLERHHVSAHVVDRRRRCVAATAAPAEPWVSRDP